MIELSVVSGTYNRLPYLQRMVASVRTSLPFGVPYEIVLVDGGSTDGTQAWARQQPDVTLIEQGRLLGAIQAFGAGFERARGRYVVIGGDDVIYQGYTLARALAFMHRHPDVGMGCFYQDRGGQTLHVAMQPAHFPDGRMASVPYIQKGIIPRWLGDALGWWGHRDPVMSRARTYGGDNWLTSRAYEAGWSAVPIPDTAIHDALPNDELTRINNPPRDDDHPDTVVYLSVFPRGPELGKPRSVFPPANWQSPLRILYAPIYEPGHAVQHQQKRGLRRALQRKGLVWEVDYLTDGANALLRAADIWQPDLILLQLHDSQLFTSWHMQQLRTRHPAAQIVNWNGDVYSRAEQDDYIRALKQVDLHTVVNAAIVQEYASRGVRTAYWQIGWEPDGVGHEPDASTPAHDIVFLANGYSAQRHHLGSLLKSLPYNVGIYGDFWPAGSAYPPTTYDFRAGCRLYRAAKIALSDDQWQQRGFVSNRLLQILVAGGALAFQQWVPGLEEILGFRHEEHLIYWRDMDDLERLLAFWLAPDMAERRQRIVRRGQQFTIQHHSFEARVHELMTLLTPPQAEPGVDPVLSAFHEVRHG